MPTQHVWDHLQDVQHSFLRTMGLTDDVAFTQFALTPLHFRRDVAMLGFLFKCAHRQVSDSAHTLFRAAPPVIERSRRQPSNTTALLERCDGRHLEMLKNGLFGAVEVFNKLPEEVVRLLDVHAFQRALTKTARLELTNGSPRWACICPGRVFAPLIFSTLSFFIVHFFHVSVLFSEWYVFHSFCLWQSLYLLMFCGQPKSSKLFVRTLLDCLDCLFDNFFDNI